jgi:hypothetical protein
MREQLASLIILQLLKDHSKYDINPKMSDMKKLGIKGGYKSATPPIEKSGLDTKKNPCHSTKLRQGEVGT